MNAHFPRRPHSVTFVLWGVFLLAAWNTARVIAFARQAGILIQQGAVPDPRWLLAVSMIWMVVWWGMMVLLWQKRPFTRRAIPLLLTLYSCYQLTLVIFFTQTPLARQIVPIFALFYTSLVLLSYWGLNRKTAVTTYFERRA